MMNDNLETVSGEALALMEVLKLHAPGVKWTWGLVGTFERALLKRGYIIKMEPNISADIVKNLRSQGVPI